jgi:hypothetical protein
MKRQNRKRNNNGAVARVGPPSVKYIDLVTDKASTVASTYKTQQAYQVKQLLPSLISTKQRLVRFRRFVVNFSSVEPDTGAIPASVGVMLESVDPVTGTMIPITRMIQLSEANPRTLSANLGSEFGRWFYTTDNFKVLIVSIYNIPEVSFVNDFTITIRAEVDLQIPEPTKV